MGLKVESSHALRYSVVGMLLLGLVGSIAFAGTLKIVNVQAAGSSFTFAAVGDNGDDDPANDQINASSNTFKAAGGKGISFVQTLGDLAYDPSSSVSSAAGWCQWATNNMKSTNSNVDIPLMIAAGNHEAQDFTAGFSIEDYTSAIECVNPLEAQTTYYAGSNANYAKDYYYDYPAVSPNLRVININPGLTYQVGGVHDYSVAGPLYNWVSNAIDSAKSAGEWVVITYHVPYINAGSTHGNDMSGSVYGPYAQQFTDLYNLLANKKVDLILNGHEHNYQRTKQFSLGTGCTSIAHDSYNANCVLAHTGSSGDPYVKGSGPVELIIGTGGHKPSTILTNDADYAYMAKTADGSGDCGLVKFDVSDTTLTGTFVNACGGSLADTFTIATATDTVAPSVSVTNPAQGATVSGTTVSIAATATDNIGITKVEFYLGSNMLGQSSTAPYGLAWNSTSVANGTYSLTVQAYDAAGNITTSTPVSITVSNTSNVPEVTSFDVPNRGGTTATVSLTGSCQSVGTSGAAQSTPGSIDNTKLLTSFAFTSTCTTAGGAVNVNTDLGGKYDIASLRIYKTQSDGSLKDVTSSVTIQDQQVNGTTHTIITFSVIDGGSGDSDGALNSTISDPVYVLDTSSSSLASTGVDATVITIVAICALIVGTAVTIKRI